jgi:hypothetical protein
MKNWVIAAIVAALIGGGTTYLLLSGDDQPAPAPEAGSEQPADDEAVEEPSEDPVAETLDLDDPRLYREPRNISYTTSLSFGFESDESEGRILGMGGHVYEPSERVDMTVTAEGSASVGVTGCFSQGDIPTFVSPYDTYLEKGGLLGGVATLLEAGASANGVVVDRYAISEENLDPHDPTSPDVRTIDEAYIDVAREGGFVVNLVINGRGVSTLLSGGGGEGQIDYALTFSDFDLNIELSLPPGCEA